MELKRQSNLFFLNTFVIIHLKCLERRIVTYSYAGPLPVRTTVNSIMIEGAKSDTESE